jgi:hypothetical protein
MPRNAPSDGTVIIAYIEGGVVRGGPRSCIRQTNRPMPAGDRFQRGGVVRRQGVGSILFAKLIAEARSKGYRSLRITTGAQNQAMRALASKFGAHLTFRHGESTGSIDLKPQEISLQVGDAGDGGHDRHRRRTPMVQFQSRLLEVAFADVRLGTDGLIGDIGSDPIRTEARSPSAGALVVAEFPDNPALDHDGALRALFARDHPRRWNAPPYGRLSSLRPARIRSAVPSGTPRFQLVLPDRR